MAQTFPPQPKFLFLQSETIPKKPGRVCKRFPQALIDHRNKVRVENGSSYRNTFPFSENHNFFAALISFAFSFFISHFDAAFPAFDSIFSICLMSGSETRLQLIEKYCCKIFLRLSQKDLANIRHHRTEKSEVFKGYVSRDLGIYKQNRLLRSAFTQY